MKPEDIKHKLSTWSKKISLDYPGLKIRFEYNSARGVFLVSLYPDEIQDLDRFSLEVMRFEDELEDLYGYDAPLFCDNENLFTLSQEAETIMGLPETPNIKVWCIELDNPFTETLSYNLAA